MSDKSFLGSGMKFPPQINLATGRFTVSKNEENIKESVYLILTTNIGERFLRPDFGSSLQSYAFMDTDVTSLNLMVRTIQQEIESQEPRIQNVEVIVDATTRQGCLLIDIGYTIIESNIRDNLVYPFYLDNVTEEEEYNSEQYQNGGNYDEPIEEIFN